MRSAVTGGKSQAGGPLKPGFGLSGAVLEIREQEAVKKLSFRATGRRDAGFVEVLRPSDIARST
jgi:hypothetical protein